MRESAGAWSLTDHVVLGLMAEQPRHGFAVARELGAEASIGRIWTVHRPLVYRAIDHLTAGGLIEPTHTERGAQGPNRTVYRATRKGRDRHRRWLERPVDHPRDARTELLVKLLFLGREGRSRRTLAEAQLQRFRPMILGLEHAATATSDAERLVGLWRLETLRGINNMLEQLIHDERAAARRSRVAMS